MSQIRGIRWVQKHIPCTRLPVWINFKVYFYPFDPSGFDKWYRILKTKIQKRIIRCAFEKHFKWSVPKFCKNKSYTNRDYKNRGQTGTAQKWVPLLLFFKIISHHSLLYRCFGILYKVTPTGQIGKNQSSEKKSKKPYTYRQARQDASWTRE